MLAKILIINKVSGYLVREFYILSLELIQTGLRPRHYIDMPVYLALAAVLLLTGQMAVANGHISTWSGDVQFRGPNSTVERWPVNGDTVMNGSVVRTGKNSLLRTEWPDHSVLQMGSNSNVTFAEAGDNPTVVLNAGTVRMRSTSKDVSLSSGSFTMQWTTADAAVRRLKENEFQISVLEGNLTVTGVQLKAGQKLTYPSLEVTQLTAADVAQLLELILLKGSEGLKERQLAVALFTSTKGASANAARIFENDHEAYKNHFGD